MWRRNRAAFVLALLGGALVALPEARAQNPAAAAAAERPARMEAIGGSNIKKITLTPKAAQRLDIQTGQVRQDASGRKVVPYAAIVYDKDGTTWVYTNPQALTFIRHIHRRGTHQGRRRRAEGRPCRRRARSATTGAPQLYGAEKGVGH